MMNTQQLPEGFTTDGIALSMADEKVQIKEIEDLGVSIQEAGGLSAYIQDTKRILAENGIKIQWADDIANEANEFSGEPTINAPSYESELELEHSMSMGG